MSSSPVPGDDLFAQARVLVVDDVASNVALLEAILRRAGVVELRSTTDPRQACDLYRSLSPDLVLLDLHMPHLDGVELMTDLIALRGDDEYVPIVVLTADSTPEARELALSGGAHDFLTKPFDRNEVLLRARNLLLTRALHARVAQRNVELSAELARKGEAQERVEAEHTRKSERVRAALDAGEPTMVFQPIVELDGGRVVGFEALSRFRSEPARTPDLWFGEAADVGLGTELELAAVGAALAQLPLMPHEAFLTVNVSPSTAMAPDLVGMLAPVGERIVLEITEHAPVADYDALLDSLGALRRHGVRLAVDDAGAGFASLHHILRLRPELIKLDISLTRDIEGDPVKRALAAALVRFAGETGAMLVAEGIEHEGERRALVDLGVGWGQGYALARPDSLQHHLAASGTRAGL